MAKRHKIKARRRLSVRAVERGKFPIKVKQREPADEPAMSLFQKAVEQKPDETPEQRKKREAFTKRAEALRKRVADRDPSLVTTTRLPYREESTLYDLVFRSPLMAA
jgi:hypothetical protein